jgi:hypothetical protein
MEKDLSIVKLAIIVAIPWKAGVLEADSRFWVTVEPKLPPPVANRQQIPKIQVLISDHGSRLSRIRDLILAI